MATTRSCTAIGVMEDLGEGGHITVGCAVELPQDLFCIFEVLVGHFGFTTETRGYASADPFAGFRGWKIGGGAKEGTVEVMGGFFGGIGCHGDDLGWCLSWLCAR